jgi:hypothetical protein
MNAAGTLYLSAEAPIATIAKDGTFVLTLLAIDQFSENLETPWRITWCGSEAAMFWDFSQAYLTENQPLNVRAVDIKTFCNARFGGAEVHAKADRIAINWYLSTTTRLNAASTKPITEYAT